MGTGGGGSGPLPADPDLAELLAAWSALHPAKRRVVMNIVRGAAPGAAQDRRGGAGTADGSGEG